MDQRHSVLSRKILGRRGPGDLGRRQLHSLSSFVDVVRSAHSDLIFFESCTANYDFDEWLANMTNKLEIGLSTNFQYQLRCDHGVVLVRSKPRMSAHVPYTAWQRIWPVDQVNWISGRQPVTPPFDSCPPPCPPQKWKQFDKVKKSLESFYNDDWWGVSAADKYEMKTLLRVWGDKPEDACPLPPEWSDFTDVISSFARPPRACVSPPRRPPPLVPAPYQPLGLRVPRRGRGRGRTARGRGRGNRGRRRAGRGRGRPGRGHRRVGRVIGNYQ